MYYKHCRLTNSSRTIMMMIIIIYIYIYICLTSIFTPTGW